MDGGTAVEAYVDVFDDVGEIVEVEWEGVDAYVLHAAAEVEGVVEVEELREEVDEVVDDFEAALGAGEAGYDGVYL